MQFDYVWLATHAALITIPYSNHQQPLQYHIQGQQINHT